MKYYEIVIDPTGKRCKGQFLDETMAAKLISKGYTVVFR